MNRIARPIGRARIETRETCRRQTRRRHDLGKHALEIPLQKQRLSQGNRNRLLVRPQFLRLLQDRLGFLALTHSHVQIAEKQSRVEVLRILLKSILRFDDRRPIIAFGLEASCLFEVPGVGSTIDAVTTAYKREAQ